MKIRTFAAITLLAAGLLTRVCAQPALSFSGVNSNSYQDTLSRMLGWQFTVTTQLDVVSLGWFDWNDDGLAQSHQIGIWDVTNTGAPLVSAFVPSGTSGTMNNHFRYVTLGSPLTLQPGNTYRVAGFDSGLGGDAHVWDIVLGGYPNIEVFSFNRDPRITLISGGGIGAGMGSFGYPTPTVGDGRSVLMGPNLLIAVPEPATTTLLMMLGAAGAVMAGRYRRVRRT